MKSTSVLRTAIAAAAVLAAQPAVSAPILYASNGHLYDFVPTEYINWYMALDLAANATPIPGYTSYLATITDAGENTFVRTLLLLAGNRTDVWLAGTDMGTEGVWTWAAGPETGQIFHGPGAPAGSYDNWSAGEPNNFGNVEHFLQMKNAAGEWNDVSFGRIDGGYVVEYSRAVPEPAEWALMLAGFGLTGAALRRRRRATVAA